MRRIISICAALIIMTITSGAENSAPSQSYSEKKLTLISETSNPVIDGGVATSIRTGLFLTESWLREWRGEEKRSAGDVFFYQVATGFEGLLDFEVGVSGETEAVMAGILFNTTGNKRLFDFFGVDVKLGLAVGPMITKSVVDGRWGWGVAVIPISFNF